MYITKEQLEARLNRPEVTIIEKVRKEREKGEARLNHNERALIGILEQTDTQKNIAKLMGVSAQTVSNVSRGMVAPTQGLDKELRDDVAKGREELATDRLNREALIQEQLATNLAAALGHVANNLSSTDATEASKIAVDMSKILDRVTGGREDRNGNRTAIIINVPSMKEEKAYQTITV